MDFIKKKSLRNKIWNLYQQDDVSNNILERIVNNRKIENLHCFLGKKLKNFWPTVAQIDDLDKAIKFTINALHNKQKIGIVGDYDVDGSTATALLVIFFQQIGMNFIYKIPNRLTDGYGVSINILKSFFEQNVDCVITVDNGTSAFEAIDFCKKNNKTVVILDHHTLQGDINADAFVNPQRRPDSHLKFLCAAGVVFVFLVELNKELFKQKIINTKIDMYQYIDMVANATICDVMPLVGLNRCLVSEGIKKLYKNPHPGFKILLEKHDYIDTETMGFYLGPYINAPGRFGKAEKAVNFMVETDPLKLKNIVIELVSLNIQRREIESSITEKALEMNNNEPVLFLSGKHWHEGVIGIVAGRVKERFQKPVFIFTQYENTYKGSARSISGFNVGSCIKAALKAGLAIYGGGHELAGGLTTKKFEELKQFILNYYKENADIQDNILKIEECISLSAVNHSTYDELEKIGPFGTQNEKPVFLFTNCYIEHYQVIANKHCLFTIKSGILNKSVKAIVFNISSDPIEQLRSYKGNIHIAASLTKSKNYIQLRIEDAILD